MERLEIKHRETLDILQFNSQEEINENKCAEEYIKRRAMVFKLLSGLSNTYGISYYVWSKAANLYKKCMRKELNTDKEAIETMICCFSIAIKYYNTATSFSYVEICSKPCFGITPSSLSNREVDILINLDWEIKDESIASSFIEKIRILRKFMIDETKMKTIISSKLTEAVIMEYDKNENFDGIPREILALSILTGILPFFKVEEKNFISSEYYSRLSQEDKTLLDHLIKTIHKIKHKT